MGGRYAPYHKKSEMHHLSSNADWLGATLSSPQDKKDFVDMRVKRLLNAGVISALACMVKADSAILTDQTKELLARCAAVGGAGARGAWRQEAGWGDDRNGGE